ncbi:hypothetical protein CI238_13193 [Colletotrichum incanum]|uniref:Uncharacterized protein n=1 Tax=Colletotrichum incanum TaxID=1573173 RepID=A0A161VYZ6_COLIC|nr:hypothetical protein CI238_13193 [Colletotrichum incanum]
MTLSITLSLNENQTNVLQEPELCNEAHTLGVQFLDMVGLARDFSSALQEPRPHKSRNSFLRFVFEQSHVHNQETAERKLKLQALNGISLVLCAATYTEKMVLGFSDGRFNILIEHCSNFLGDPAVVASKLPVEVIQTSLAAPVNAVDDEAYRRFRDDLENFQPGMRNVKASISLGLRLGHDEFGTELGSWPEEQVTALLRGPQYNTFSVILRQLSRLYKETGRKIPCSARLIEALVTVSKSGPPVDRMQLLDTAAEMLTDSASASTWATVVHQRSIVLRLLGDPLRSEQEILMCLKRLPKLPDHLLRSLQLSLANNLIYQLKYTDANRIARGIQISQTFHTDQVQTLWDQIYCVGRIMRGQGDFESAKTCFERCSETHDIRTSKKIIIQSALADLYCELDYISRDKQRHYLLRARLSLEPALELAGVTNSKSRRRLLLSLSEVCLREGRVFEARETLKELLSHYGDVKSFDVVDRLGHVRSYIALARTYPPGQAETYWREALRLNAEYNPSEEEVFTCAIIYLHLSWLDHCSGKMEEAQNMYAYAQKILCKRRPEYLLPGVGTYVFDDIQYKLQRTGL